MFLFLDSETTGLYGSDHIVEVAIVDEQGNVLLNELAKPPISIPEEATGIHGIDDVMVKDARSSADVAKSAVELCKGHDVVIYNAPFDCAFLHGLEDASSAIYCCMQRFSTYYGDWSDYWGSYKWQSLAQAAYSSDYLQTDAHRALDDALACRHVWLWLHRAEIETQAELIGREVETAMRQVWDKTEPERPCAFEVERKTREQRTKLLFEAINAFKKTRRKFIVEMGKDEQHEKVSSYLYRYAPSSLLLSDKFSEERHRRRQISWNPKKDWIGLYKDELVVRVIEQLIQENPLPNIERWRYK